ncbi:MAG: 50S ribosomal protein L17 [Planctomycetes bacterium]|nr:50S ribosomal protein L17 [Planctomycetota bacterium]
MRHRVAGRRLGRDTQHRLAMRRNMVASLFEHETISTTIEKAKEVKAFAEKLITIAKKGTLAARRQAISMLGNRDIVGNEDGKTVKKGTVIQKLFSDIAPRYLDRPGGYTRIVRLAMRRLGDNGQLVLLQLVGKEEAVQEKTKSASKKRSSRKVAKTEEAVEVEEVVEAEEVVEETITEEVDKTAEVTETKESTEAETGKTDETDTQADETEKKQ